MPWVPFGTSHTSLDISKALILATTVDAVVQEGYEVYAACLRDV